MNISEGVPYKLFVVEPGLLCLYLCMCQLTNTRVYTEVEYAMRRGVPTTTYPVFNLFSTSHIQMQLMRNLLRLFM